jgi:hypothetical protein
MLKTSAHNMQRSHAATALEAITWLAVPLSVYVLAVWLQWLWVVRASHRQVAITLLCVACFFTLVVAVASGLPLPWALPLLCAGPVIVIAYNEHGRIHCGNFFQVR